MHRSQQPWSFCASHPEPRAPEVLPDKPAGILSSAYWMTLGSSFCVGESLQADVAFCSPTNHEDPCGRGLGPNKNRGALSECLQMSCLFKSPAPEAVQRLTAGHSVSAAQLLRIMTRQGERQRSPNAFDICCSGSQGGCLEAPGCHGSSCGSG